MTKRKVDTFIRPMLNEHWDVLLKALKNVLIYDILTKQDDFYAQVRCTWKQEGVLMEHGYVRGVEKEDSMMVTVTFEGVTGLLNHLLEYRKV